MVDITDTWAMVVVAWEEVVLFPSELAIGNAAMKSAATTISPRMFAVSVAVPAALVLPLWPILVILLPWTTPLSTA
jgi:hypothetical protein